MCECVCLCVSVSVCECECVCECVCEGECVCEWVCECECVGLKIGSLETIGLISSPDHSRVSYLYFLLGERQCPCNLTTQQFTCKLAVNVFVIFPDQPACNF